MLGVLARYVAREILVYALGVLGVVMAIFIVRRFGSLLGDVAEGPLALPIIGELLVLRTITALPTMLPAVIYAAVILALGRLYRENEMTALAACGVGPASTFKIVGAVALLGAALIGALSFSVRPWAQSRFRDVKREVVAGAELGQLTPGRFYELDAAGELVVFADRRSATRRDVVEDVFVQDRSGGRLTILHSQRAVEYRDDQRGYRFLQLLDGHRYELRPRGGGFEISSYESYEELVLRADLPGVMRSAPEPYRSPLTLLRSNDRADMADLQWELAMPLSAVLLAFLAVPLSRTEPRQGRSAKLFLAIFLYVAYRHLLGVVKEWIANGTVAPYPGLWAVHAACLAVCIALIMVDARGSWSIFSRRAGEGARLDGSLARGRFGAGS